MTHHQAILWMTIDRHPVMLKALIRERLKDTGWNIHEVSYQELAKLDALDLEEVRGVLLAPARQLPVEHLKRLTNCSLIQIWSSGYDKFNFQDAKAAGLPVANNHGANAVSVAEHTFLLMLGVSRRAPEMHARVTDGKWAGNDHGMASYSLNGKNLGIIGMGHIGSLVATRAQAFGMRVSFYDPYVTQSKAPCGATQVTLDELLQQADYISLHLHHTEQTRGMLDEKAFAKMVRQPFLINPSRAELVEKSALLKALKNGTIRGLGIDAHYDEPTSSVDELWKFTSVFASPHVAGSTVDSYGETIDACIHNLGSAMKGHAPQGLIT